MTFYQLELDQSVFVSKNCQLFLVLYLDNLISFASDEACFTKILIQLSLKFKTTDLGKIFHYFGIEVDVEIEEKILFWQIAYFIKILKRFQMSDCKSVSIISNLYIGYSLFLLESQAYKVHIKGYQSTINFMIWSLVYIQPDIIYSERVFSR